MIQMCAIISESEYELAGQSCIIICRSAPTTFKKNGFMDMVLE